LSGPVSNIIRPLPAGFNDWYQRGYVAISVFSWPFELVEDSGAGFSAGLEIRSFLLTAVAE